MSRALHLLVNIRPKAFFMKKLEQFERRPVIPEAAEETKVSMALPSTTFSSGSWITLERFRKDNSSTFPQAIACGKVCLS
jgi:hypothetical protein